MAAKTKWTLARIRQLRELYPITEHWSTLLEAFPFSTHRGIQAKAQCLGLQKPIASCARLKHKEDFFDKWKEESAYVLGWLEADGHIRRVARASKWASDQVVFTCSQKDLAHLKKLRDIVGSDAKISKNRYKLKGYKKTYINRRFIVSSRTWGPFLRGHIRRGHVPKDIPPELLHHYIRGYFDGDGSFYWAKQAQNIQANIVGTPKSLVRSIAFKLRPITGSKLTVYKKTTSDNCWYVSMAARAASKLRDWMYLHSSIYLQRKFKKAGRCKPTCRGG